jgi:hypothetical protein
MRRLLPLALLAMLAACGTTEKPAPRLAALPSPSPPAAAAPASDQPASWKAVLIAGDDAEPAFDNAVNAMAHKLESFGLPPRDITILHATGPDFQLATGFNIENAFTALEPTSGEGCFVFVTSHGAPQRGLVMKRAHAFLTPGDLGGMLDQACGGRPTVVIASGCYSGSFAKTPPLPAANRTILTAARADRPSFGCDAGLRYTVFDRCVLESMDRGISWSDVMDRTRACVTANEAALHVNAPSEPQLWVGSAEERLRVFSRQDN